MANDKKISELGPLATADPSDLLVIVDIDAAPSTTKKITAEDLFASSLVGEFASLQLPTGAIIDEFSIDGNLSGDSDTAVPTEKAVKSYVDNAISTLSSNSISEGDSSVVVADSTAGANVIITVDSTAIATYTTGGLTLVSGATVNEFSTDGTLSGNSDTAVPTEQAVKTYVDSTVNSYIPTKIENGDASVQCIDSTSADYINFIDASNVIATMTEDGFRLESGVRINEFSNDDTLAGNSATAVPTEKAVKTYIDNKIISTGVLNVYQISSDSTAFNGDAVLVDTTSGNVNVQMDTYPDSRVIVKKITSDSNAVIISVSGGGTIDGELTHTITEHNKSYTYISDGDNYYVV